jgi:hypothetical protein
MVTGGLEWPYSRGVESRLGCKTFPPVFEPALDQRRVFSQFQLVAKLLLRGYVGLRQQDI